jgi:AAA ATPase domain
MTELPSGAVTFLFSDIEGSTRLVKAQVLVSQATQTLIEDEEEELAFALTELGERRLKDLDRPVRLFELAVAGAVPKPPPREPAHAPALAPIVGRVAELQVVSAAYARAVAGQAQVMLISGEAGIGKTRLVEELTGRARSAADGTQVRVGESAPMAGAALPFAVTAPNSLGGPTPHG